MWLFQLLRRAGQDFVDDDCLSGAAAMAYYSIFSLPPLLYLVVSVSLALGATPEQVRGAAARQLMLSASEPAKANGGDEAVLPESRLRSPGLLGRIAGGALLLFSATGLLAQLQVNLNRAWEVRARPNKSGLLRIALKRVFSLGMVLVAAFLLLVSLVLTTLIDEIVAYLQQGAPTAWGLVLGNLLNGLVGLLVTTALFAAMFKVLPDAKMSWRDAWCGAAMTAVLFLIGKSLIAWYLASVDIDSTWGHAAASTLGILVWIYYTTVILLFGAELTQVWACEYGGGIVPTDDAEHVVKEEHVVSRGARAAG
jgi:membrane protein